MFYVLCFMFYIVCSNCLYYAPNHPEALNNLGILEIRKSQNMLKAKHFVHMAMKYGEGFLYEPFYNGGLCPIV